MPILPNSKLYNIKEENGRRKRSLQVTHLMTMIEGKNVGIWKLGKDQWELMGRFLLSKENILT